MRLWHFVSPVWREQGRRCARDFSCVIFTPFSLHNALFENGVEAIMTAIRWHTAISEDPASVLVWVVHDFISYNFPFPEW